MTDFWKEIESGAKCVRLVEQMLREEEFRELIHELSYEIDVLDGIVETVPLNAILNKIGLKIDKVPSDIHPMVSALQDMVQEVIKTKSEEEMVEEVLNKSPEFLEMFNELVEIKKVGMSNAEAIKKTERIRKLKEKQGLVQVTDN